MWPQTDCKSYIHVVCPLKLREALTNLVVVEGRPRSPPGDYC